MAPFLLTFLAVALAMLAGREAVRVSRIAAAGANAGGLLALVGVAGLAACALAAWLAGNFAPLLGSQQKGWLVAAALVLAALEVIFLAAPKPPREPTQSFGAIGLVLFAGVLADATGLLVLSLSVATGEPVLVAAGGGLGAAMVLGLAALAGADWAKLPRPPLSYAIGAALLAAGLVVAFFPPEALG